MNLTEKQLIFGSLTALSRFGSDVSFKPVDLVSKDCNSYWFGHNEKAFKWGHGSRQRCPSH